jgi:hypothetical protein
MLRTCAFSLLVASAAASASDGMEVSIDTLPAEVRGFVDPGTRPIALEKGDLNGDGRQDFVLVLERQKAQASDEDIEEDQRPLLLLVRQADGKLKEAKRNSKLVYCSSCGGMMGDPFQGVEVGSKSFTVSHYGGSAWRWAVDYKFAYSRKDDTWQLVRVEESNFHASDPDNGENKVYTPPRDFGKIDIADFDPEKWKGQGPR